MNRERQAVMTDPLALAGKPATYHAADGAKGITAHIVKGVVVPDAEGRPTIQSLAMIPAGTVTPAWGDRLQIGAEWWEVGGLLSEDEHYARLIVRSKRD